MTSIRKLLKSTSLYDSSLIRILRRQYSKMFANRLQNATGSLDYTFSNGMKMRLDLSRYIDARISIEGNYEEDVRDHFFKQLPTALDLFVDIGANIGLFSLDARVRYPNLRIVSFEPSSELGECFKKNLLLNGFSNIELRQKAVSNKIGDLKFYLSTQPKNFDAGKVNSGTNSAIFNNLRHDKEILVEAVTLDEEFREFNLQNRDAVVALKIDVEGFELQVVQGAKSLLQRQNCFLLVEVFDQNIREFDIFMNEVGYRCVSQDVGHNRIYSRTTELAEI